MSTAAKRLTGPARTWKVGGYVIELGDWNGFDQYAIFDNGQYLDTHDSFVMAKRWCTKNAKTTQTNLFSDVC